MAKLNSLPDPEVRAACSGLIDFYVWKGIPVARRWPRFKPRAPHAAEAEGQLRFSAVAKMTGLVSSSTREAYREHGPGASRTWVDMFRGTALGSSTVYRLNDG